jgi:hypothetical protein
MVERFNPHVGAFGIRQDLFGIIDILALDPVRGVVGIQSTTGSGFPDHYKKLTVDKLQATMDWLQTPGTKLELWAWRKLLAKRGGKAKIWSPRIVEITIDGLIENHEFDGLTPADYFELAKAEGEDDGDDAE